MLAGGLEHFSIQLGMSSSQLLLTHLFFQRGRAKNHQAVSHVHPWLDGWFLWKLFIGKGCGRGTEFDSRTAFRKILNGMWRQITMAKFLALSNETGLNYSNSWNTGPSVHLYHIHCSRWLKRVFFLHRQFLSFIWKERLREEFLYMSLSPCGWTCYFETCWFPVFNGWNWTSAGTGEIEVRRLSLVSMAMRTEERSLEQYWKLCSKIQ